MSPRPAGALPPDDRPCVVVRDPRELVALVPYRLGFRPTDSLVLMSVRRAGVGSPQVGLVMRVDLPTTCPRDDLPGDLDDPARPDDPGHDDETVDPVRQLVGRLADHVAADGATGAVVVVYADDPVCPCLTSCVVEALADRDVGLLDVWQVEGTRYRSLSCEDPACCPAEGWPTSDLDGTQVSAEMVALGRAVLPSRADLAGDLRPADPRVRARVVARIRRSSAGSSSSAGRLRLNRDVLATWRRLVAAVDPVPADDGLGEDGLGGGVLDEGVLDEGVLDEGARSLDTSDGAVVAGPADPTDGTLAAGRVEGRRPGPATARGEPVPPADAARMLVGLQDPQVRDAVLLSCVPTSRSVLSATLAGRQSGDVVRAFDGVFVGGRDAAVPDHELLRRAEEVLRSLVRQSPDSHLASPLGLLAWTAWWAGDGGRASVVVDLALTADPGHRLALLVSSALDAGLPPGWARPSGPTGVVGSGRGRRLGSP